MSRAPRYLVTATSPDAPADPPPFDAPGPACRAADALAAAGFGVELLVVGADGRGVAVRDRAALIRGLDEVLVAGLRAEAAAVAAAERGVA